MHRSYRRPPVAPTMTEVTSVKAATEHWADYPELAAADRYVAADVRSSAWLPRPASARHRAMPAAASAPRHSDQVRSPAVRGQCGTISPARRRDAPTT